jgi:hypothetical protein
MLQNFGHVLSVRPSYSLSTSKIQNKRIYLSCAQVTVKDTKLTSTGPLLITHWEWAARQFWSFAWVPEFAWQNYQFTIFVNWLKWWRHRRCRAKRLKTEHAKKSVSKKSITRQRWVREFISQSSKVLRIKLVSTTQVYEPVRPIYLPRQPRVQYLGGRPESRVYKNRRSSLSVLSANEFRPLEV